MKKSDTWLMGVIFVLIGMTIGGAVYPLVTPQTKTIQTKVNK